MKVGKYSTIKYPYKYYNTKYYSTQRNIIKLYIKKQMISIIHKYKNQNYLLKNLKIPLSFTYKTNYTSYILH